MRKIFFYLSLGLSAWIIAAIATVVALPLIIQGRCYFLNFWPLCHNGETWPAAVIILIIFFLLSLAGYKSFNWLIAEKKSVSLMIIPIIIITIAASFITLPFTSADTVFYFNAGKASAGGINPYTSNWDAGNPFSFPKKESLNNGIMYGPIAVFLFEIVYRFSGGDIVSFTIIWKALMFLVFALVGIIIYRLVNHRSDFSKISFYAFWLTQPLLLWEWVANGHFDGVWIIFVLLAFYFAKQNLWSVVLLFLTIGIWVKFIPLLITPWFILWWWQKIGKENWKKLSVHAAAGVLFSLVVTFISWRPYWRGLAVFNSLIVQSKWAVSSIFSAIYYSLIPIFNRIAGQYSHQVLTGIVHLFLLGSLLYLLFPFFKLIYLILRKRLFWSSSQYAAAIFISLFVYLAVWQKSFWPWYFTWLIPFGLVSLLEISDKNFKKIFLWISLAPLFFYLPQMIMGEGATLRLRFNYYVVIVIILYPLIELIKWRKNNYGIKAEN